MKPILLIEKRACVGRRAYTDNGGSVFSRQTGRPTIDDSFATFSISGVRYYSERPANSGDAETINDQLERMERAFA